EGVLVLLEDRAVHFIRDDEIVVVAGVPAVDGALEGAVRVGVLLLARDAVDLGADLGGAGHVDVLHGVGEALLDGVDDRDLGGAGDLGPLGLQRVHAAELLGGAGAL